MNTPPPVHRRLAGRLGLLLLLLLALQSTITGLALHTWLKARDLSRHKLELREQASLLIPTLQDSLAIWAGQGPGPARQAALRHHMRRSLGEPKAMSLVWVDPAGNLAAAGFLERDPRLSELLDLAVSGMSDATLEGWASRHGLALVARDLPTGRLLLAGESSGRFWTAGGPALLAAILAGSAAIAGLAAWWLARPLLRRFHTFSLAFTALGEGGFAHRLEDSRQDELGLLATEFNQMAARVEGLTEELARSDRRRRQLLSEVSHELGAPLTTLTGRLDLLLARTDLDPGARDSLRLCLQQARRLDLLVSDLLDLARLDDAGLRLRRDQVDLRDVVDQEVAAVELACLDRDILLDWIRPSQPLLVAGDEARLAQILRNLLRNSVQQLAGWTEGERHVAVRLGQESERVVLEVCDSGPGIRPEDLAQLFDRYHRPHTSRGEGSGLGLCVSRRLAELHDGTLVGDSAGLGRGATFTLDLPAAPA